MATNVPAFNFRFSKKKKKQFPARSIILLANKQASGEKSQRNMFLGEECGPFTFTELLEIEGPRKENEDDRANRFVQLEKFPPQLFPIAICSP